jgi:hypothetical protein
MDTSSSELDVDESILKRVKKAFTRYSQTVVRCCTSIMPYSYAQTVITHLLYGTVICQPLLLAAWVIASSGTVPLAVSDPLALCSAVWLQHREIQIL